MQLFTFLGDFSFQNLFLKFIPFLSIFEAIQQAIILQAKNFWNLDLTIRPK